MSGNKTKIDYDLLGGLVGSAWRDSYSESRQQELWAEFQDITTRMKLWLGSPDEFHRFTRSLSNTMRGRCYNCGVETDTRWSVGVYCCPTCAVNKPGVIVKGFAADGQGESNG